MPTGAVAPMHDARMETNLPQATCLVPSMALAKHSRILGMNVEYAHVQDTA
jgi:hypothetical protein